MARSEIKKNNSTTVTKKAENLITFEFPIPKIVIKKN